ncbi:hypothetical protein [Nonomuraea basaltis]|uniref:hypothetical protein n=1 Tax=Nonomuraea basaltis TaxID=2495887 RepID=UPI00110C4F36|nr:hypothetical protein [Nonomuraea basaltis]TMR92634.1 hypothetical protein EJK15_43635 [Nonomuraea basaltis]
MSTDYSRPLRMAAQGSGLAEPGLRVRLEAVHLHLTAEPDVQGVTDALKILIANLRRLPVHLDLAPHGLPSRLTEQCQALTRAIDPDRPLSLGPTAIYPVTDGSVHLGPHPPRGTAISAVPDGHGVRLRRPAVGYPTLAGTASGLGSVMTAAMLTAECFKTIVAAWG